MAIAAAAAVESEVSPATLARLTQIADEAQRISAMCRDVLGAPVQSSVVSVDELAKSIATPATLVSDVTVELRLEPSSVVGNSNALGRALWNLVDNAVRAAGAGGRIRVEVVDNGTAVEVTVSDSGPGFGASGSGIAGLGLRIAGRVAAEHGGELIVTQHGALGGASVILQLPSVHRLAVAKPS
jgi:signal transduction histidine kinase